MKYLFFICFLIAGSFSLQAQDFEELALPLSEPSKRGKLKVDVRQGPVTVKGTARQDVLVKYRKLEKRDHDHDHDHDHEDGDNDNTDGLRRLSGSSGNLEFEQRDNVVYIDSEGWNNPVELVVEVPKNFDLDITTYNNTHIHVEDINGEVVTESYTGSVSGKGIRGSMVASTYSGKIEVELLEVTPETPMYFTCYSGKIDLTLPPSIKGTLKIQSQNGEVLTGFDVNLRKEVQRVNKNGSKNYRVSINEWITGDINGGGPEIKLKNYSSNIYIRKGK